MNMRSRSIPRLLSILALSAFWSTSPAAAAPKIVGSFEEVVADAAVEVLKRTGNQPVSIGLFTPIRLSSSTSGPAIDELLKKALEKIDPASVKDDAPFEVKGDFELQKVDKDQDAKRTKAEFLLSDFLPNGLKVIALTFRVITVGTGERKTFELTRFVDDNKSIGRILQISGPVESGNGTDREKRLERNQRITDLAGKSESFIDPAAPTIIKSVKASPYAIEILAEPLAEHLQHKDRPGAHHPIALTARIDPKKGLAFVDVPRDFVYEIRAFNASGQEAAIAVCIDGLDIFQFSEDVDKHTGNPLYSHLVFDKETTVVGWHRSVGGARFDRFLVTEYGKGASSQTGRPAAGQTGVIQVAFSHSFIPLTNGRLRTTANETGFGPPEHVEQKPVTREITTAVDFVTVRYTR